MHWGKCDAACRLAHGSGQERWCLPKGLWRKHTANGYTANALAPDSLTDLGGGACFNDARVDVRPVSESGISSADGQSSGRAG